MKKILFLFILLFFIFSIFIHNNFSVTQNICISSQIAEPIFNINFNVPITLDNSNTSTKYSFSINNFNNENFSDIPFSYYFYIENLPPDFSCQCFMDNTEIFLTNFKSETFLINNSNKEEHVFFINLNYIGNYSAPIVSNVNIKVVYSFSEYSNLIENNFLNVNIVENEKNEATSSPSSTSSKEQSKKSSATPSPSVPNINSDVFIDTKTNIQIQISK